jgi:copper chaperone CopZ
MKHTLKVKGMHCKSCAMLIEDSLNEIGAIDVKVDVAKGLVTLTSDKDKKIIAKSIEAAGEYKVE